MERVRVQYSQIQSETICVELSGKNLKNPEPNIVAINVPGRKMRVTPAKVISAFRQEKGYKDRIMTYLQ